MKALVLVLLSMAMIGSARCEIPDEVMWPIMLVKRLERLSQEKKYAEIFDSLASDYRKDVSRKWWIKRSEELGWTISKARIGTLYHSGDFADAPVRSDTLIVGGNVHHIDAVAFFVREGGVWKLWNFPFVDPDLPNRTRWPPPYEKGQNLFIENPRPSRK